MKYYIKVEKDVRVFVEDLNSESDSTILFVHGWPLNHNMYEYQMNVLPDLGFRCVAMDLRGYGKSDRPIHGYDYDTMARDIKYVIDALKLDNVLLVGHSMGGAISIRYISNYDSYKVSKLCLIGAAAPSWSNTGEWTFGHSKEEINMFIEQSENDRPNFINNVRDMFFHKYVTQPFGNWFSDLCMEAAGWSTIKSLVALRDENLFNDLNKINIPTLILHGVHDKVCPIEFAVYMKNEIKDSILVELSESGHCAFYEEKEKVNDSIVTFINQDM